MTVITKSGMRKGGDFLIEETPAGEIFTPEEWNEEQKMIAQSCRDFLQMEVFPKLDKLDSMEYPDLMPSLLKKCGQLGLLGTSLPEKYGGFGMDFITNLLIDEAFGSGHSFIVSYAAHTGIGTTPILYFGTEEQKSRYLPDLASGKKLAAYCLTEPDAGSDARAGRTRARLDRDRKNYILSGQKMWITNGGFADILIVFAKIDDDEDLSAFIVESDAEGIYMNEEEKKMGIKGSSTRQIYFNDCRVPVRNQLGERGKGFKMALNILNIGRIKLAAATLGGAKLALRKSIQYAGDRKQFGKTIGSFGIIKHKLGSMAARLYATESALYRTGHQIEKNLHEILEDKPEDTAARMKAIGEFAVECAILKVHGSEMGDFMVDESVQIHGGMGFSADGPVERGYRDSRINRIFEGTNEINRMVIIDMLLKKAFQGHLDLMSSALQIQKELTSIPDTRQSRDQDFLSAEKDLLANLKKTTLMIAGAAVNKLMHRLKEEQEILMHLADMVIEIYVAESGLLRAEKNLYGEEKNTPQLTLARICLYHALEIVSRSAREAIYGFSEGDEQRMLLLGLKRFTRHEPFNLKEARREIAGLMLERKGYPAEDL
ncbi:MAG: acyl-CoA dehydrogenase family protein [Cyclobacteriaceae bacterium]|nr:acyl-CoA dehydrogenase family protein [Cyclobacteriaceae bacterium]